MLDQRVLISQGAATTIFACVDQDLQQHPGAYLVDCKVHQPHKAALDAELAAKLWEVTEQQLATAEQGQQEQHQQ